MANDLQAPLFVGLKDAARLTGVSIYYLRRKIASGELHPLRSGTKQLLHVPTLIDYLEQEAGGEG